MGEAISIHISCACCRNLSAVSELFQSSLHRKNAYRSFWPRHEAPGRDTARFVRSSMSGPRKEIQVLKVSNPPSSQPSKRGVIAGKVAWKRPCWDWHKTYWTLSNSHPAALIKKSQACTSPAIWHRKSYGQKTYRRTQRAQYHPVEILPAQSSISKDGKSS